MIPTEIIKKIRRIQIRTSHLVSDLFAGQYHSAFKGQGMEFQEVREYVPGDEIRTIDWNVTARMGHPYIKKFTEERELTVMLLVDISASNLFGSTEQFKKDLAAEIAAVLAFSAIRNQDRVGLILFTEEVELYIPPKKGTAHVLRVIREVLYHQARRSGTAIEPALTFLNHIRSRRAVCFLISDFIDQDFSQALRVTAQRHDLVAVTIADKRESVWPAIGLVDWIDAETGEHVLVDTSDGHTRRRLAQLQEDRRAALRDTFRKSGVDSIPAFAGESYEQEFVKFFAMRERRFRH